MEQKSIYPWDISEKIRKSLEEAVSVVFGENITGDNISVAPPPNKEFGDYSSPMALKLAKTLKKSPVEIAGGLKTYFESTPVDYIKEVTVTKPGYINFLLDYDQYAKDVLQNINTKGKNFGENKSGEEKKFVIEHTNINPNKAAHIGHLRNACLGDTVAKLAEHCGYEVEIQNYIDDTGTAVADVVVGFHYLGEKYDGKQRFDYFCWDLYTKVNLLYEEDEELREKQAEVLHLIEKGDNELADLAKETSKKIVDCHLDTMKRLDVFYGLLTWESDIMSMGFWRHAFDKLKEQGGIIYEESGPNEGCWVVKLGDLEEFEKLENPDKVLLRSSGTATYTAKDIAYQMWKFGVLGKDFLYSPYCTQANAEVLWTSDMDGNKMDCFGKADKVMNVIDIRQKYLQDVLRLSLYKLGYLKEAENSIHFGYEVVALSTAAAKELGVQVSDERDIYAMAGRRGIGVKADDLIDRAIEKTTEEVSRRHEDMLKEEQKKLGTLIAIGAIRYYMLRYNTNSVIVFDFQEALSLQGNTGPYLQYSYARASNILRKAELDQEKIKSLSAVQTPLDMTQEEKDIIKKFAEFPLVVEKAFAEVAPSVLCDYTHSLATTFMSFYEKAPVLAAEKDERDFRLFLVISFKVVMGAALHVLGIPAPEKM